MVLRWALLAVLAPICLAQYDYQMAPRPQPRPPPPRPPPPPPPADDPYGATEAPAPPAPQPPPPTPVQFVQKCPDCPAPQVVVVVPEQQPAIPTNLFTQQLMMQALGFGGLNSLGSGNQQQQMQTMAMMHLMQAQGMSYYQQMQMLGMMQMAKRFGGRPVPLQPVFRTTAEYSYPGKKIVFWPPYISARPKEVVRPAPAPAPSGYGPEPQPQIETSQYNSNQESTNIPDISQTFPQPPSGLAYDKEQTKRRHA